MVALAYDGLCTFEFGVAVELFGLPRPEMGPGWYRFAVAGVDDGPLRATGGIRMMTDGGPDLIAQAGTVVVPGWRGVEAAVPPALCAALRTAHARGCRLMSICSGVFVLAAAGLLDGRRATTHWRYTQALAARFPAITVVPDVLYVDEGSILTSAGSAAGIDLGLHLIRRDFGWAAANTVARRLVVAPHREGGQAQFVERAVPVPHEAARLSPLIAGLADDLATPHTVASLAGAAGMSERTFLRRFAAATGTTPARWLTAARIARARALLEETALSLDAIAAATGFGTAAGLRHHFTPAVGLTPSAYRTRFGRG